MKRIALFAALFIAASLPAHAAGPFQSCGVSAFVGATATTTAASLDAPGTPDVLKIDGLGASGVSGGGGVFCDVQITGTPLVLGVWGDYVAHSAEFSVTAFGAPADIITLSLDRQWAVGGKVGYALSDFVLAYAVGGYTRASFSDIAVIGGTSLGVPDMSGYLVGGGLETKIGNGFSIDVRYTYSHLDKGDVDPCAGCGLTIGLSPEIHTARVGLTYRFNVDRATPAVLK